MNSYTSRNKPSRSTRIKLISLFSPLEVDVAISVIRQVMNERTRKESNLSQNRDREGEISPHGVGEHQVCQSIPSLYRLTCFTLHFATLKGSSGGRGGARSFPTRQPKPEATSTDFGKCQCKIFSITLA